MKNTNLTKPAENREKLKKEKNQKNDLQKVPLMCQFFPRFPGKSPSYKEGVRHSVPGGSCTGSAGGANAQLLPHHFQWFPPSQCEGDHWYQAGIKKYRVKPGMTKKIRDDDSNK